MIRAWLRAVVLLAVITAAAGFWISRPQSLPDLAFAGLSGDAARGEQVFWAGGCASCHAAPGAEGDARLVLSGGRRFPSPFGTFVAPNISPHPVAGIGGWSIADLVNAMTRGVSPDGRHYYPAFPYTSYVRAEPQDIADLHAFLMTLPASDAPSQPHDVGFPFNIRRGLGLWKALFLRPDWVTPEPEDAVVRRGRYLVEALGHCGECHTPRGPLGNSLYDRWLAGAPSPSGKGRIPPLRAPRFDWSENDIAYYLKTGFTPDFDSAGGEMSEVVQNMAHLPDADLAAIAAYLKALPPLQP